MNRKCWYLKQLNLFKTLPEKEIDIISKHSLDKEYSQRQVVLEPQDRDKVFILKMKNNFRTSLQEVNASFFYLPA